MWIRRLSIAFSLLLLTSNGAVADEIKLSVRQITRGDQHHFFGYIGQSLTTPWNGSGRYIVALRTSFHDRMPEPGEAAEIVLVDTESDYEVTPIETTRAWNFQQGTMFYWHPQQPETQLFFNDRDPRTGWVFTVLYDVKRRRRIREYCFDDLPVANGGVSPTGEFFLAINYGRMARLRPVTGYPGAADPTVSANAPDNDGVFRVDVATGKRTLLASFQELRDALRDKYPKIDEMEFYINHSLSSRDGRFVYFFARARLGAISMFANVPFSVRTDGTRLTRHTHIGGHPEWDEGRIVIGAKNGRQVRYDIERREIVGYLGSPDIFPDPGGDVSLSPNADWFVCGYDTREGRYNEYAILRRSDGANARSPQFSRGPFIRGRLRIDPAPRWNRDQTAILVPGWSDEGTRQLYLIEIVD